MKKFLIFTLFIALSVGLIALYSDVDLSSINSLWASENSSTSADTEQIEPEQKMKRTLSAKHLARVEKRAQRNKEYKQHIDSLIIARRYEFDPMSFQMEPAGSMHQINNPSADLIINGDYMDITLPYIKGAVPPYRQVLLNYTTYDIQDYVAEQTDNGWNISFSSSLYSANDYKFSLQVYSVSGMVSLSISTPLYNTVSYSGSLAAIY